ncbi:metal ABC transporter ATP-binding protein [bacterium]|nr:metal ABC transporter ATP-binding protein [bacterium]
MNQPGFRGDDSHKPCAIEVKALSLAIEGRTILEDVSFNLDAGEFLCICGPNGAGKTMLLKAVLGLSKPTLGSVSLLGLSPREGRRKTGYVPQRKNFDRMFPARVVEVIAAHLSGAWPLVVSAEARDKAAAALRIVGGEHLLDKELRDLSGGELQRAFLARALAAEPELLILDEPMAGVDAQGISDITSLLDGIAKQRRLTIVMITHSLAVVEHCATKLIFMEAGKIRAFGNPSELLRDPSFHELAFTGHDHEHAVTSGKGEY